MAAPFPIIVIRIALPRRGNYFHVTSAARPLAHAVRNRFMCAFIRENVHMVVGTAGRPSPMAAHYVSMSGFILVRSLMPAAYVHELSTNVSCCVSTYVLIIRDSMLFGARIIVLSAQPTYRHPMSLYSISSSTATQTQPNSVSQL